MEKYIQVIVPLALEGTLTYLLPEALAGKTVRGSRVVVPVGKGKLYTGVVDEVLTALPEGVTREQLKAVVAVPDDFPLLTPAALDLWKWMADYYLCSLGEVMKAALPADMRPSAAQSALGSRVLKALKPYAVAAGEPDAGVEQGAVQPRVLSAMQEQKLRDICRLFRERETVLLHGVTSSGKTEIYTALIRQTVQEGGQVLYLLPEIALTTQITSRLRRQLGDWMGVYHSRQTDRQRRDLWLRQLSAGALPVVVGARSALFLPYRRLRLVIVDEEHETSYKQQDPAPRYNARDVAMVLAARCGAKVLLGTATPSFESYYNARRGKYGLVELTERYGQALLPDICIENVAELRRKKLMKTPFSPRLLGEIRAAVAGGQQAILFLNRRGYAPVLQCHTCGWTPRCTRCDVPLTFHRRSHSLQCHYCGAVYSVPGQCPACEGTELRDLGYGTEKIEAALRSLVPEARTARLDLDSTRSRASYEQILSDFSAGRTDVLIGTQMVTKGLDFERVRVVGIVNADQMLVQPDFRASERAFQMMSQVAGRAGRRQSRGIVFIQTRQPEVPVLGYVAGHRYRELYLSEMEERLAFGYPPFVRLITIYLKHREEVVCEAASRRLSELLRPHFSDSLLGPDRPAVARVHLLYIRKLVLKVPAGLSPGSVRRTLRAAAAAVTADKAFRNVAVYFDADPL
ncbi:MAG: primosomal protein N' [Alloprevotella sp.]